jgi:hypothetical protein
MLILTVVLLLETVLSITYLYTLNKRLEYLEEEISNLKTQNIKKLLKG